MQAAPSEDICWWLDGEKCGGCGAIRGQRSDVTGDTAAIIKTYEGSSDQDLANWHIRPCACGSHQPTLRSNGHLTSRWGRTNGAPRCCKEKKICWVMLMWQNSAWPPPLRANRSCLWRGGRRSISLIRLHRLSISVRWTPGTGRRRQDPPSSVSQATPLTWS